MPVRQGPTGLIITSSRASLHPDNETRLMTVETEASPHWTRAAMIAIALRKKMVKSVDLAWPALQAWLATGERRVSVPYGEALAGPMPAKAVRVRRDFMNLLSLIEAHALLHRASREPDGEGQIVATLSDYRIVADLVGPILSSANGAAVSDEMRHTVTVVSELMRYAENHLGAIAQKLGVDHSTASRRCRAALEAGYLEKRKYPRTNKIEYRPGMPLPKAGVRVLPTVDKLEKVWRGEGASDVGSK